MNAEILLSTKRNNYLDCCYYGSIFVSNRKKIYFQKGMDKKTIVFMRSLAKPLQLASFADFNFFSDLALKPSDIALFSASHAGSPLHVAHLREILKRYKLKARDLELAAQEPLDKRAFNKRASKLHNNCSGKHIMMLLACEYLGFNKQGYTKSTHPLQLIIQKKQNELSNFKSDILTFDGCSTPLWGLPIEALIKAYFNFFINEKYQIIINSIVKNPYLFGGYDRLDSEIIKLSKGKLFSKVGAGGFVLVYNFEADEILLIKLTQNNNEMRKLITLDALNKLNWLKSDIKEWEYNQKNERVAKYCYEFQI